MLRRSLPVPLALLLCSSWLWHITRWQGLFLSAYLVTQQGAPPIANQLVGVCIFAPTILGGYVGARSQEAGRSRTLVLTTQIALVPLSLLMAVSVLWDYGSAWAVYPFMFAYGVGFVVNLTAQRVLILHRAGPELGARAMNAEVTGLSGAMMVGPLIGGVTAEMFGLPAAFSILVVLLAVSVLLLLISTRGVDWLSEQVAEPAAAPASTVDSEGTTRPTRALWRSPAMLLVLLLTLVYDVFFFAFTPLIPVIAEELRADAVMTGVLASAAGFVQLVVCAYLVVRPLRREMAAYIGGVALALVCLAGLTWAPAIAAAVLILGVSGIGQALVASTQATLPITLVAERDRATAMGLVATAIGVALPVGMIALGVGANILGARGAMLASAVVGLFVLAVILLANSRLLRGRLPVPSDGTAGLGREGDAVAAQSQL